MKNKHLLLLLFLFTAPLLHAGFKIPPEVFTMDKFKEAQEAAKSSGKPITFLYSDDDSKSKTGSIVSEEIIQAFKKDTIIVYAEAKKDWKAIPSHVRKAINDAGMYFPIAVIFDSNLKELLFTIPYESDRNRRRNFIQDAKKKIKP